MGAVAFTRSQSCFSISALVSLVALAVAAIALDDGRGGQGCCDGSIIDDDNALSKYSEAELATLLRHAVEQSDVNQVYQLLGLGVPIVESSEGGLIPLLNLVARQGETEAAIQVATALVAHGAQPEAVDKNGVSAVDISIARGLAKFESVFQKLMRFGSEAFEEPPGTWMLSPRGTATDHDVYSNTVTGRKTVTVPPACAWQYFAENRPPFFNQVTGSAQWHTPQALSWKHLRVIDADSCPAAAESTLSENSYQRSVDFYWNWRTNASRPTSQRPHELGHGLGLDLMVAQWFVRADTGEKRFEDPALTTWQKLYTSEHGDHSKHGQQIAYWFHPMTGVSTWEQPAEAAWRPISPRRGRPMRYWNAVTGEFQESIPSTYAWKPANAVVYVDEPRYDEIVQGIGGQLHLHSA